MQGLRVGVNLAIAIALHNIPEVCKSTYQPFWLSNLRILICSYMLHHCHLG